MAWTKTKVAMIGASVAIIVAIAFTVTVIEKSVWPSMDESFWSNSQHRSFDGSTGNFVTNVPQIVLIRPTKFPNTGYITVGGEKMIGVNASIASILYHAYAVDSMVRTEFPSNLPKGRFDYLANLPVGSRKAFQEELKRKFGITARHETRVRDALLLKVKETNAPGLKISKKYEHDRTMHNKVGSGTIIVHHAPVQGIVRYLEQKLNQPVFDQTGLTNNFDIELKWDAGNETGESERIKQAVLEQLGLELVPSREPIEMLVIKRAKN